MKLDERFKQLQQHPQNEDMQQRIRMKLDEKQTRKQWNMLGSRFGELSFILLIIGLASFLSITSLTNVNHATSNSIDGIYSYESKDYEAFRARPSTNYLGMKNVTSNEMIRFFEQIDELSPIGPQQHLYNDYQVVIKYKNGEQRRFEVATTYIYDVDRNIYYPGLEAFPTILYSQFFAAHFGEPKIPTIILPLCIMAITIFVSYYYSRRKISAPKNVKMMWLSIGLLIAIMAAINYYVANIGLLYRPLLFVAVILLFYLQWWSIKRNVVNPLILKVEKYKTLAFVVLLIVFIWLE